MLLYYDLKESGNATLIIMVIVCDGIKFIFRAIQLRISWHIFIRIWFNGCLLGHNGRLKQRATKRRDHFYMALDSLFIIPGN